MNSEPARILVVDDEPDLELLMRQRFRQHIKTGQFVFEFALNGKEALQKLKENGDFDAVMTDINMPEMDGLTLLARLKESENEHHYKAIVVTAYSDLVNIRTAMNRGAFDFITKPIDFADLEATLIKTVSETGVIKRGLRAQSELGNAILLKEQAIRSEQFKQQFLANMSHEIRTPLNAVCGIINLLLHKAPKPEQLFYLQTMRQASGNLLAIINDILDLAKIEAGKITLEMVPFNMYEQLNSAVHTLMFKAEDKDLELVLNIDDDVPEFVVGDQVRLSQILINLLSNAIKFTAKGKVELKVVVEKSIENKKWLAFKIIDQGIGIAPENIDKIFESFSQEKEDTTRKFGGTGLGLTITKQLVELHEGSILVESVQGKGSTFTVLMPYEVSTGSNVLSDSVIPMHDDSDIQTTVNILLAEDQPFNQMVAVDTLAILFKDAKVQIANNGKEAHELAKTNDFDVVLMDIHMPEMDGYEATRAIRSIPGKRGEVPILAMTASVIKEDVNRCYDAGMNDFIPKPFDPSELKHKIIQLMKS